VGHRHQLSPGGVRTGRADRPGDARRVDRRVNGPDGAAELGWPACAASGRCWFEALTGNFGDHPRVHGAAMLDRIDACTAMEERPGHKISTRRSPVRPSACPARVIPRSSTAPQDHPRRDRRRPSRSRPLDMASGPGCARAKPLRRGGAKPTPTRNGDPWLKGILGQGGGPRRRPRQMAPTSRPVPGIASRRRGAQTCHGRVGHTFLISVCTCHQRAGRYNDLGGAYSTDRLPTQQVSPPSPPCSQPPHRLSHPDQSRSAATRSTPRDRRFPVGLARFTDVIRAALDDRGLGECRKSRLRTGYGNWNPVQSARLRLSMTPWWSGGGEDLPRESRAAAQQSRWNWP